MEKTDKSRLALNIIKRRKSLGFKSARAFAEHANIPYGTLRDIEAGYSDGQRDTKTAIAAALGCTVDDLLAPPGQPQPAPIQPRLVEVDELKEILRDTIKTEIALSDEEKELITEWRKAPLDAQVAALFFLSRDVRKLEALAPQKRGPLAAAGKFLMKHPISNRKAR